MTLPLLTVMVRHGESEGNAAKRRSRANDHTAFTADFRKRHTRTWRLTDVGRAQAQKAGDWLKKEFYSNGSLGLDHFLTSNYTRATETAGLLGLPNARWYKEFDLRERNWGDLEICPEPERKERFGKDLEEREEEPFLWVPPGNGESQSHLCGRLLAGPIATLRRRYSDRRVIMVSHGGVMWGTRIIYERMSEERYKKLYLSGEEKHRIENCDIILYSRVDPEKGLPGTSVNWVRFVRPTVSPIFDSGWQKIARETFTNEKLLKEVERHERMIE